MLKILFPIFLIYTVPILTQELTLIGVQVLHRTCEQLLSFHSLDTHVLLCDVWFYTDDSSTFYQLQTQDGRAHELDFDELQIPQHNNR